MKSASLIGVDVSVAQLRNRPQCRVEFQAGLRGKKFDGAAADGDSVIAADELGLRGKIGVAHAAVGAELEHAVGEPVQGIFKGALQVRQITEPAHDVGRLLNVRHQRRHDLDFRGAGMPLLARTRSNAADHKFLRRGGDDRADEIAHVERRQQFRVKRIGVHVGFAGAERVVANRADRLPRRIS